MHAPLGTRLVLVPLSLLCLAACGAPESAIRAPAPVNPAQVEVAYNQACYSMGAAHAQSVKAGRYRPVTLKVHSWPSSDAKVRAGQSITEAAFTSALADGRLRSALVLGRGGVGKSELSRMVEASICGNARVVRLGLAWDVVPALKSAPAGANIILDRAAAMMKFKGKDAKTAIDTPWQVAPGCCCWTVWTRSRWVIVRASCAMWPRPCRP